MAIRVVFNLYDEQGYWVARVAGDTLELAIVEARRHSVTRMTESTLQAISVNPEAAVALHDHPAWKILMAALRFIDEPAVATVATTVDLTPRVYRSQPDRLPISSKPSRTRALPCKRGLSAN